jgi:hypothetical protein
VDKTKPMMGNHFFLLTPEIGRRKGAGLNKGDGAGQEETGSFLGIHFRRSRRSGSCCGFRGCSSSSRRRFSRCWPAGLGGGRFRCGACFHLIHERNQLRLVPEPQATAEMSPTYFSKEWCESLKEAVVQPEV